MEQKVIDVFAENLRFARKARGYSQALMAERLGIARSSYAGYETGKRSPDVRCSPGSLKNCLCRRTSFWAVTIMERLISFGKRKQSITRSPDNSVEDYFALPSRGITS